jgi:hypothetical protein
MLDPTAQSRRQRAYRRRQAAGSLVVTIELGQKEIARLYRLGYLRDCELEDRHRIGDAIRMLLANILDA